MKAILLMLVTASVSLAQSPTNAASTTSPAVATCDTTYDFYYSAKEAEYLRQNPAYAILDQKNGRSRGVPTVRYPRLYWRDKPYTEYVKQGAPKPSGYTDYVLVGSGCMSETKASGVY